MPDVADLLALAARAAKAAGDQLAARRGAFAGIGLQNGRDIKLNADEQA